MVQTWTHGIKVGSWYRHGLLLLTTPMVLTHPHGIVSVDLNPTHTKRPNVARMQDFFGLLDRLSHFFMYLL